MKRITHIAFLVTALALALTCGLAGCGKKPTGGGGVATVNGIRWTMDSYTLGVGEHTLKAVNEPSGTEDGIAFSLISIVENIQLSGKTLTISSRAEDGVKFKIKAASTYDPSIYKQQEFVVSNAQGVQKIQISTAAEFAAIGASADALSRDYELTCDIVLDAAFAPIGVADVENDDGTVTPGIPFNGSLNGNGHTISGVEIVKTSGGFNVGVFNMVGELGLIENAGFRGSVSASGWSGAIAGINKGTIRNCFADVAVTVAGTSAGALVGVNKQGGTISCCYGLGAVVAESAPNDSPRSGGLVAANEGIMTAVFGDRETMGSDNYIAFTPAKDDTAMLTTLAMQTALTYRNAGWDETVWYLADGSYPVLRTPDFVEPEKAVILVITNEDTVIDATKAASYQMTAVVMNSENKDVVWSLKEAADGISVSADGLVTVDVSAARDNGSVTVVATAAADETVRQEKTFTIYTKVLPQRVEVSTERQLHQLVEDARYLTRDVVLTADIALSEYAAWEGVNGFAGTFDGGGHTISGLNATGIAGFFASVNGATADTVVIHGLRLTGAIASSTRYGGTLVGDLNCGVVENCISEVTLTVPEGFHAGGFVGVISSSTKPNFATVRNCVYTGAIQAADKDLVGAFCAANNGEMQGCFADGTVSGASKMDSVSGGTEGLKTTAEMQTAATFDGFDTAWWTLADGSYPALIVQG